VRLAKWLKRNCSSEILIKEHKQVSEFDGNMREKESFSMDLEELTELFAPFGPVLEASVIKDYGFVVRGIDIEDFD